VQNQQRQRAAAGAQRLMPTRSWQGRLAESCGGNLAASAPAAPLPLLILHGGLRVLLFLLNGGIAPLVVLKLAQLAPLRPRQAAFGLQLLDPLLVAVGRPPSSADRRSGFAWRPAVRHGEAGSARGARSGRAAAWIPIAAGAAGCCAQRRLLLIGGLVLLRVLGARCAAIGRARGARCGRAAASIQAVASAASMCLLATALLVTALARSSSTARFAGAAGRLAGAAPRASPRGSRSCRAGSTVSSVAWRYERRLLRPDSVLLRCRTDNRRLPGDLRWRCRADHRGGCCPWRRAPAAARGAGAGAARGAAAAGAAFLPVLRCSVANRRRQHG